MRPSFLVPAGLLLLGACVPQQAATPVSDISTAAQRYWNRQVVIEGQITTVEANPVGTSRGVYVIIDDSDQSGLKVQSKNLPAPGEMYRVEALVVQDPSNTATPVLQELRRSRLNNPLYLYLMVGSGALAVILIVTLIVSLLRRPAPAPQPVAAAGGLHTLEYAAPPAPPMPMHASMASPAPARRASMDDATIPFRGAALEDDPTVAFEYWGYRAEVVEGPDQGRVVQVGVSPFLIGRSGGRANHLELSDRTVSRQQCIIRRSARNGHFTLEHQGGTNATYVDGESVQVAPLTDGTRFRMGSTVVQFTKDRA